MIYTFPNNSMVAVHDIFDPLPDFMRRADTLFVDIPYNQSLLTNFSYREGVSLSAANTARFDDFTARLFDCIVEIAPTFTFVEVGKEALPDYVIRLRGLYKYVTFYNATYYKKRENKCYVIHATNDAKRKRYAELEDKDEAEIVHWLCANHPFRCIGDLCMGLGLVGLAAYAAGKPFVGTELNHDRLLNLVNKLGTIHVPDAAG